MMHGRGRTKRFLVWLLRSQKTAENSLIRASPGYMKRAKKGELLDWPLYPLLEILGARDLGTAISHWATEYTKHGLCILASI